MIQIEGKKCKKSFFLRFLQKNIEKRLILVTRKWILFILGTGGFCYTEIQIVRQLET